MKRFLSFLLAALLLTAVSCAKSPAPVSTSASDTAPSEPAETKPTEEAPFRLDSLTINGNDLSSYKIIYAKSEFGTSGRKFNTEYDFWKLIAQHVSEVLADVTGVTIPIASESEPESEFEILVGPTARAASEYTSKLGIYKYEIRVDGAKLVLGGGYKQPRYCAFPFNVYGSTYHAVEHLVEHLKGLGQKTADLPADLVLTGTQDLTTVACVGDSITQGVGSTDSLVYAYPAVIQRFLWQDYCVVNYGNSGKTMRDDLADSYMETSQFKNLKKYAEDIDYCFIMLGTNDSNRDRTFDKKDDETFLRSGRELVNAVAEKNSSTHFVICSCPAYFGNDGFASDHVVDLVVELYDDLKASGLTVSFLDVRTFTAELGASKFPDSLHPGNDGHAEMGKFFANAVMNLADGREP